MGGSGRLLEVYTELLIFPACSQMTETFAEKRSEFCSRMTHTPFEAIFPELGICSGPFIAVSGLFLAFSLCFHNRLV